MYEVVQSIMKLGTIEEKKPDKRNIGIKPSSEDLNINEHCYDGVAYFFPTIHVRNDSMALGEWTIIKVFNRIALNGRNHFEGYTVLRNDQVVSIVDDRHDLINYTAKLPRR